MSANPPSLIRTCDRCGAELPPGARYCANCGQAVRTSSDPAPTYWSDTAPPPGPVSTYPTYSAAFDSGGGIGKLFSGQGRIGRLEWFLTIAGIWLALLVVWGLIYATDSAAFALILALGIFVVTTVVAICAGVKRLHDFDQSGWLYLLMLVPFASFILMLVLLFVPGSSGQNRYGFADSGSVMG